MRENKLCKLEQVDARRRPTFDPASSSPPFSSSSLPARKEGRSLAGEKATGEHSNHRKKTKTKQKTLNISKQINKAMTKQYIYIYRYKKKRKKNVQ